MIKLGLELKENDGNINIKLIDPTKKQLDSASDNEKLTAQILKEVLETKLLDMMNSYEQKEQKED